MVPWWTAVVGISVQVRMDHSVEVRERLSTLSVNLLLLRWDSMAKVNYKRNHLRAHSSKGLESMTIMAGSVAVGRQTVMVLEQ